MYSSFCGAQLDLHTPPRAESREGRRVDITYTPDYALIGRDSTRGKCLITWHPGAGQEDRVTSMVSLIRIEFAPCEIGFIPSSFLHS